MTMMKIKDHYRLNKMTPLKKWMKRKGVKYQWVMDETGNRYSRQWLSQVFNGKSKPSPDLVKKLQEITGLTEEEILGGEK